MKFTILASMLIIHYTQFVCMIPKNIEDLQRNIALDQYGHALIQEPLTRDHKIYDFGRGLHGHYYYAVSLSTICTGVKKGF